VFEERGQLLIGDANIFIQNKKTKRIEKGTNIDKYLNVIL
jgi:hypothetical protein